MIEVVKDETMSSFVERIRKFLFMLYPFADYRLELHKVTEQKGISDGFYLFFSDAKSGYVMVIQLIDDEIMKMIENSNYNPFTQNNYKLAFVMFQEQVKARRTLLKMRGSSCQD